MAASVTVPFSPLSPCRFVVLSIIRGMPVAIRGAGSLRAVMAASVTSPFSLSWFFCPELSSGVGCFYSWSCGPRIVPAPRVLWTAFGRISCPLPVSSSAVSWISPRAEPGCRARFLFFSSRKRRGEVFPFSCGDVGSAAVLEMYGCVWGGEGVLRSSRVTFCPAG